MNLKSGKKNYNIRILREIMLGPIDIKKRILQKKHTRKEYKNQKRKVLVLIPNKRDFWKLKEESKKTKKPKNQT